MTAEDAKEMRLAMLRICAICATQKNCDGCPALKNGCLFVVGKLPPRRWTERVDLRGMRNTANQNPMISQKIEPWKCHDCREHGCYRNEIDPGNDTPCEHFELW